MTAGWRGECSFVGPFGGYGRERARDTRDGGLARRVPDKESFAVIASPCCKMKIVI